MDFDNFEPAESLQDEMAIEGRAEWDHESRECEDCSYDDDYEDDGQPSEYQEWQDYMGGDDWDHGQYDHGDY